MDGECSLQYRTEHHVCSIQQIGPRFPFHMLASCGDEATDDETYLSPMLSYRTKGAQVSDTLNNGTADRESAFEIACTQTLSSVRKSTTGSFNTW